MDNLSQIIYISVEANILFNSRPCHIVTTYFSTNHVSIIFPYTPGSLSPVSLSTSNKRGKVHIM